MISLLQSNEMKAKTFMETKVVPVLHDIISKANPIAYQIWGKNACRQVAIIGSVFLEELLPDYKWEVWDGDFSDIIHGQPVEYNHAWLYGINKKDNRNLLVDMSRNFHERLFIIVTENEYPSAHPEYKHMKLIRKKKLNVKQQLKEKEYYTGLKGKKLYAAIKNQLNQTH